MFSWESLVDESRLVDCPKKYPSISRNALSSVSGIESLNARLATWAKAIIINRIAPIIVAADSRSIKESRTLELAGWQPPESMDDKVYDRRS